MGVSCTLPDGQLAIPVFGNGGDQVSSDAMQFSMFSVCRLGLILFTDKLHINFIW